MSSNVQLRRQREWMHRRNPRCFWCGRVTVLCKETGKTASKHLPKNAATIDHLRSRYDPTRRIPARNREVRRVLACWECNNLRNAAEQREIAAERPDELWRRSGSYPRDMERA